MFLEKELKIKKEMKANLLLKNNGFKIGDIK